MIRSRVPVRLSSCLFLVLSGLAAACGGESEPEAIPQDPRIVPVERTPLTAVDLAGLDSGNVAMELPWTENRVRKEPGPSAPATVTGVRTSSHADFDRVVFDLRTPNGFPGYEINRIAPDHEMTCNGEPATVAVPGDDRLFIRVHPVRPDESAGRRAVRVGTQDLDMDRFQRAGVVCDGDRALTWVGELEAGSRVRVLEMRNPPRLVVDIR